MHNCSVNKTGVTIMFRTRTAASVPTVCSVLSQTPKNRKTKTTNGGNGIARALEQDGSSVSVH